MHEAVTCHDEKVPEYMSRPRVARQTSKTTNVRCCINVLGLGVEQLLRASMGIRAHPRLTSGEASVDHYGTQSRGCAGQTVRPSLHSISQTSVGKLLNRPIL